MCSLTLPLLEAFSDLCSVEPHVLLWLLTLRLYRDCLSPTSMWEPWQQGLLIGAANLGVKQSMSPPRAVI